MECNLIRYHSVANQSNCGNRFKDLFGTNEITVTTLEKYDAISRYWKPIVFQYPLYDLVRNLLWVTNQVAVTTLETFDTI